MLYMLYDIIVLEPSIMFHVSSWPCNHYCDCVIWCDWCVTVWLWCHSNPNSKFRKVKKKTLNEKTWVQASHLWYYPPPSRFLLLEELVSSSFFIILSSLFYLFQFLSNFFKYSYLNFPSSLSYNIFAVNFPGNSPLLKFFSSIQSIFSCLLTFVFILSSNSTT